MSIVSLNGLNPSLTTPSRSARAEPAEASGSGVTATLASIATAASDGFSATVSFSGQALHALEHAGEQAVDAVVDGGTALAHAAGTAVAELDDLAVGTWHALQHAAEGAAHAGEVVADAVREGAHEIASTARSVGKELGHYAQVGLRATGEAVSEVASGTVMAAAAVGKTLIAML